MELVHETPQPHSPTLFRYLPSAPDSIKIHRLVCKAWKDASVPQWRTLTPVTVVQDPQRGDVNQGLTSICQFLEDKEKKATSMEAFTHQNFVLKWWNIDSHLKDTKKDGHADLNRIFWNINSGNIKILTLSQCTLPFTFTLLLPQFWSALPNLECLSLLSCEMNRAIILGEKIGLAKGPPPVLERPSLEEKNKEIQRLLEETKNLVRNAGSPLKLKFLQVHNFTCREGLIPIEWSQIINVFGNLERILVSEQVIHEYKITGVPYNRQLKELDLMNISWDIDNLLKTPIVRLPTKKMSFNCGEGFTRELVRPILEFQAAYLLKLTLYRAPYAVPYSNFPCNIELGKLTTLHLWGTVSINLNFLKWTPALKHLSWNTSCYDEETHGARVHDMLGNEIKLLLVDNIIDNTELHEDNFKLESLQVLELESGPVSVNSIKMLGKWLPNLKTFKVTVDEDNELIEIARQWPDLERLELAHGSILTADALLQVYCTEKLFTNLKSFIWKRCPCYAAFLGMKEQSAEDELRKTCGDNVEHPWTRKGLSRGEVRKGSNCVWALFELALNGDREAYIRFVQGLKAFGDFVE